MQDVTYMIIFEKEIQIFKKIRHDSYIQSPVGIQRAVNVECNGLNRIPHVLVIL